MRQKWEEKYKKEGRGWMNLFDPDMITDEDQMVMFGEVLSAKKRGTSPSPKKKESLDKKDKIKRDLNSLDLADRKAIMDILNI